jgi:hypothetical protein
MLIQHFLLLIINCDKFSSALMVVLNLLEIYPRA